jgi:hypothetical protein
MNKLSVLWALFLWAVMAAGPAQAIDDGRGKDWRPVLQSAVATWEQAAALCPQDGTTPCTGTLGTVQVKDWVWATAPQVVQLLSYYAPAILTSPSFSVSGNQYVAPAFAFQDLFGMTTFFSGSPCGTYQQCFQFRSTSAMTASTDGYSAPAKPYGAAVTYTEQWEMAIFERTALPPSTGNFLWMWRPTGLGTTDIYANDDQGPLTSPAVGIAVSNVLANDWVGGARATLANVTLAQVSSSIAGLWLEPSDASVRVAPGAAIGTHSLVYRICNKANLARCDDATVTVTVKSFPIAAVNDQGAASMGAGGTAIANVLANDSLGGGAPTLAMVRLTQVSSTHPGVRVDALSGAVVVAPGTPHGTYAVVYRICEISNPANCAQATATVRPYLIDAVDDAVRGSSKTGGVVIASVLNNDWFNGARAGTDMVTISLPAALPKGFSLSLATGAVSVMPKTSSGIYQFSYRICEKLSPANCDQATVTVELSGRDGV